MNEKIQVFNFISNILILTILIVGGFVWADSNGVWHKAENVVSGIFGLDEGGGDYTFPNNLYIMNDLNVTHKICLNGTCINKFDELVESNQACTNGMAIVGFNSTGGIICAYPNAVYK
jgi:hypothetical protein